MDDYMPNDTDISNTNHININFNIKRLYIIFNLFKSIKI